jgi:uncharacterized repeat protein (TIGR03809 family)
MTQRFDVALRRDILVRWCNLAEQRLQHLTELFETGRWRRYHSERAFLENIQEAKSAVEIWRGLSMPEGAGDNQAARIKSTTDAPWRNPPGVTVPRGAARREPAQQVSSPPLPFPAAPRPLRLSIPPVPARIPSNQAASHAINALVVKRDPVPSLDSASKRLDLAAMQKRYPLLRNAM